MSQPAEASFSRAQGKELAVCYVISILPYFHNLHVLWDLVFSLQNASRKEEKTK